MATYELKNVQEPELFRDTFSFDRIPAIRLDGPALPASPPAEFWITDTTFRDGQQSRPPYTVEQIVRIFTFLHRIGGSRGLIRQSEFFLYGKNDQAAVDACRNLGFPYPEVTGWIRAVKSDFELVKNIGLKETGILASCSDYHIFLKLKKTRRQALDGYKAVVAAALEQGIIPRCHLEDITRADIFGFVIPMINELQDLCRDAGVNVKIRLCDTMGYGLPYPGGALPRGIPALVQAVREHTGLRPEQLEWHGHNDFHKVLVNATTAWLHGCAAANGTLFGFGERTGNPPIEGLVFEWMGLTGHHDGLEPAVITEAAAYFRRELGAEVPANYPFVGERFNTTCAGIHADGLSKNEEIYGIFDTQKWLKAPSSIAVTNNSGLAGIACWLHMNVGEKSADIRKDHPALLKVREWIDDQYRQGRVTSISDAEMRAQLAAVLPELFR